MTNNVAGPKKVAVLIRGHYACAKLTGLLNDFSGRRIFDVFAFLDESNGPIDVGNAEKLCYTKASSRDMGLDASDNDLLIDCADLLFAYAARKLPGYDYFLMIEFDVEFRRSRAAFVDDLLAALRSPHFADIDLVGPDLNKRSGDWSHFHRCSQYMTEVYGVFFPFIMQSRRAIDAIYNWRMKNEPATASSAQRIHCEALVPSVLNSSDYFKMMDLNDIFPKSYDTHSFYYGLPMLKGAMLNRCGEVVSGEMYHPVYDQAAYLEKHWRAAQDDNALRAAFIVRLADPDLPISDALRADFEARAHARSTTEKVNGKLDF